MQPTTHADMIYGQFQQYFGTYDDPSFKKMGVRAPIPGVPNPALSEMYDKFFDLSSKINSVVEEITPNDLQEPERMKEKLSRATEITNNLGRLADAQDAQDQLRGDFVNFWCRLGNALIGRGWLTGGERGIELAQEMMAHIQEKQQLVQRMQINAVLTSNPTLATKNAADLPEPYNLELQVQNGTVYISIGVDGDLKLAKKGDQMAVDLSSIIPKGESDRLKKLLIAKNLDVGFLQQLRVMINNNQNNVRDALGL